MVRDPDKSERGTAHPWNVKEEVNIGTERTIPLLVVTLKTIGKRTGRDITRNGIEHCS